MSDLFDVSQETILESVQLAQRRLMPRDFEHENAELAKSRLSRLSAREVQVLNGLVAGLPNKTIGYDLGLSPRTVEAHRAKIMRKMEVASLSALVRAAVASGAGRQHHSHDRLPRRRGRSQKRACEHRYRCRAEREVA